MNLAAGNEIRLAFVGVLCIAVGACGGSGGSASSRPVVVQSPPGTGVPPANSAPTLSGAPADSVVVGELYSFTPTASDPDGDELLFSIDNKPDWADFEEATGTLSGTAPAGSEGQYPDIRISASDGSDSTSLSPFTIDVVQVALGSATLSWTPPTQNTDGSALTDLRGYKIYHGTSAGNYTAELLVENPGVTTFVVETLVPDTYYFAVTALNLQGYESGYSNESVIDVTAE